MFEAIRSAPFDNLEIVFAGGVDHECLPMLEELRAYHNVQYRGLLSRQELCKEMLYANVFMFPSLAEGSARVVFEAMSSGCFIVATPNTGSVIKDGSGGLLIRPGDPNALTDALLWALANRNEVRRQGALNAKLVRTHFRQKNYADQIRRVYSDLCNNTRRLEVF
jgi:glycosyltransferase involved in cell wall biosynthesis